MSLPNWNQIMSFVRQLLMFLGGIAVAQGWLSTETMVELVGIALSIAGVVWGLVTHTKANTVVAASQIVAIPVAAQAKVGIKPIDAVITPTTPPAASKAV